jgi:hypothetical protein
MFFFCSGGDLGFGVTVIGSGCGLMQKRAIQREQYELQYFFKIRSDLAAALRDNIPSIIDFHRNELVALKMHAVCDRVRRACIEALNEVAESSAVAQA